MVDVSKVITVGDVSIREVNDVLQVAVHGQQAWWLTKAQFADLMQAGQKYVERTAEVL